MRRRTGQIIGIMDPKPSVLSERFADFSEGGGIPSPVNTKKASLRRDRREKEGAR